MRIFKDEGLDITIAANMDKIDALDVTLDLTTGNFSPYMKPGNTILYVNRDSNHPKITLDVIPKGINKRLSSLSSNEEIFDIAKIEYQRALTEAGHSFQLKYDPEARKTSKKKTRNRKVIWYNPPFCKSVKTNLGKIFLKIVLESFPSSHKLHKIVNRNTLKLSYSCLPNIGSKILADASKKYKGRENENMVAP